MHRTSGLQRALKETMLKINKNQRNNDNGCHGKGYFSFQCAQWVSVLGPTSKLKEKTTAKYVNGKYSTLIFNIIYFSEVVQLCIKTQGPNSQKGLVKM